MPKHKRECQHTYSGMDQDEHSWVPGRQSCCERACLNAQLTFSLILFSLISQPLHLYELLQTAEWQRNSYGTSLQTQRTTSGMTSLWREKYPLCGAHRPLGQAPTCFGQKTFSICCCQSIILVLWPAPEVSFFLGAGCHFGWQSGAGMPSPRDNKSSWLPQQEKELPI